MCCAVCVFKRGSSDSDPLNTHRKVEWAVCMHPAELVSSYCPVHHNMFWTTRLRVLTILVLAKIRKRLKLFHGSRRNQTMRKWVKCHGHLCRTGCSTCQVFRCCTVLADYTAFKIFCCSKKTTINYSNHCKEFDWSRVNQLTDGSDAQRVTHQHSTLFMFRDVYGCSQSILNFHGELCT